MGRLLALAAGLVLSLNVDDTAASVASLDCPLRQIGLDYAHSLQPWRPAAAFQEVADALNGAIEAANCSVRPKAALGDGDASRVAWAPLPAVGSGVTYVQPTSCL